jgi:hypothetical protein
MSKHSMQVVNKAATLTALKASPAIPSAAPDMLQESRHVKDTNK